ncbi:hypothetical protein [Burkholderia gladioli]|uniref:hypothetical protein n=1 Tax=Burkholderia gladioli TaxID=28095 RepID=UPI001640D538|nr:hypothetical protein [Burkholderia gladioli]MDN7465812.1 hypothetical protein [Burkholderia gladioli]
MNDRHGIKNLCKSILIATLSVACLAHAGGGLQAATNAAQTFVNAFYIFVSVCAGAYLLYEGVECWTNKGSWGRDFVPAVAKTAIVGGSLVLAAFLFSIFA